MTNKVPRGIANCNPGNIRWSKTLWQGEAASQPDPDFVTFESPLYGLRAIAKVLLSYQRAGLTTVRQMIDRWAPPVENDTGAYVNAVALGTGVDADASVDLHDMRLMSRMVQAIVLHENGQQPYSPTQLTQALALAGLETA